MAVDKGPQLAPANEKAKEEAATEKPAEKPAEAVPATPAAPTTDSAKEEMPKTEAAAPVADKEEKTPVAPPAEAGSPGVEAGGESGADVVLGTSELLGGIAGEGELTVEQIKAWLDDPKNHVVLKPTLPLGLAAGGRADRGDRREPADAGEDRTRAAALFRCAAIEGRHG